MDDGTFTPEQEVAAAPSKVLKADNFEALSRARMGIDQARVEADAIVAQAHEQAGQIRAQAQAEGQQQIAAQIAEYHARMHGEIVATRAKLARVVRDALRRIVDPVPTHELVAATVQRAISETDLGQGAVLIVAPQLMNPLKEQFALRNISPEMLDVRGDPDCPLESTILRSDFGDIELGIELQLRAIEQGLASVRDGADR